MLEALTVGFGGINLAVLLAAVWKASAWKTGIERDIRELCREVREIKRKG